MIRQCVPGEEGGHLLPEECTFPNGHFVLELPGGEKLRSNSEYTILYRAPTDNDTDLKFSNSMEPYMHQEETVISCSRILNGYRVESELARSIVSPAVILFPASAKLSAWIQFLTTSGTPEDAGRATAT